MSEKKTCPECGCGREKDGCLECSSYFYQEQFVQSLTCRLRVAEKRIEELVADYDEKIVVMLGERDNWRTLYDEARKCIAELERNLEERTLQHSVQLKNAQAFQARVHELETVNIVALTRERDEAREAIRRWLHIADFSGMHRSCSCACCAELKKVVGEM